jgi:fibrillarin-like rRNA methylase
MHLSPEQRKISMQNMASLLNAGGRLVITLRHGSFTDERTAFPVSTEEVCQLAESNNLSVLLKTPLTNDQLGRNEVVWQTVVLTK